MSVELRAMLDYARSHGWGSNARIRAGRVTGCACYWYDANDKLQKSCGSFATLKEMKDWAPN